MPFPNQVQPLVLAVLSKKMRSLHETKGLASHCKAKTTFTFYFSIINALEI